MKQTLNMRQQLYEIAIHLEEPHKICRRSTIRPPLVWTYVAYRYQKSVSLHYLPRCLHSAVTCGKTPTTITWSASSKICCHVIVTQQRPIVEQFAPEFRNLPLQAKKRI